VSIGAVFELVGRETSILIVQQPLHANRERTEVCSMSNSQSCGDANMTLSISEMHNCVFRNHDRMNPGFLQRAVMHPFPTEKRDDPSEMFVFGIEDLKEVEVFSGQTRQWCPGRDSKVTFHASRMVERTKTGIATSERQSMLPVSRYVRVSMPRLRAMFIAPGVNPALEISTPCLP